MARSTNAKAEAEEKRSVEKRGALLAQKKRADRAQKERDRRTKIGGMAKEDGYAGAEFDLGLTQSIWAMKDGEFSVDFAKKVVIQVDDFRDRDFKLTQSLGPNKAIYTTDLGDDIVMLKGYGETLLEGSSIVALRSRFVVITGVTHYKTLVGTKQAITIKSIWRTH